MKTVDSYIDAAAPFAQPILRHLRALVHKACPHATEALKWGMPFFSTHDEILCNMAAFKQHCAFGFWKVSLLKDKEGILEPHNAMGHIGRITAMEDLPSDKILLSYIKEADKLNKDGVKAPKTTEKKELVVPEILTAALKKNKAAQKTFDAFPYSHRREYIEWITEAKTEATQEKRTATAVEWMAEGKQRNWKYQK